jgi:hypothetical protein
MKKADKQCQCGSKEFITEPNSYDVYEVIDDKLEYQKTEMIEDEVKIYCRECGEEMKEERITGACYEQTSLFS